MEKKIDIIIPAYNAHKTIDKTLYSICYQTYSNMISVYIVDDCSDTTYDNILSFFKKYIDINLIRLDENKGPGVAREVGINNSKNDYIVFIDADDTFSSPRSIEMLYHEIHDNKYDFVSSIFTEVGTNLNHDFKEDEIFLHGKIYSRKFIEDNNIHFNSLRTNEDNYFNSIVIMSNPKKSYLDKQTYNWNYNPTSITRKNNHAYDYDGIYSFIDNMTDAITFAINNNKNPSIIAERSFGSLNAIYYYYLKYKEEEFLKRAKLLKKYFMENKDSFKEQAKLYKSQLSYSMESVEPEKIIYADCSFKEFLDRIGDYND